PLALAPLLKGPETRAMGYKPRTGRSRKRPTASVLIAEENANGNASAFVEIDGRRVHALPHLRRGNRRTDAQRLGTQRCQGAEVPGARADKARAGTSQSARLLPRTGRIA